MRQSRARLGPLTRTAAAHGRGVARTARTRAVREPALPIYVAAAVAAVALGWIVGQSV
ncbi:MAG TPA: hypothetical protein VFU56_02780 [Gaiellaceae bacterium]|nr:hypothetical protein [Gaiellaceae bacterium]